jgi:hypothetical protein
MTFQLCTGMDIKTVLIIFIVGMTNLFGQNENAMIVEMKTGVTHLDANQEHTYETGRWLNPRWSLQNRPMMVTSKPANGENDGTRFSTPHE